MKSSNYTPSLFTFSAMHLSSVYVCLYPQHAEFLNANCYSELSRERLDGDCDLE
jgi:hypothetical protein